MLGQGWIVDIPASSAAIKRGLIRNGERRPIAQPSHQIGIGDERLAEGNKIRGVALDGLRSELQRV